MNLTPLPRTAFDLDPEVLWVMHCAEGPVSRAAAEAVRVFLPRETKPWTLRWQEDFQGLPAATRVASAAVIGADSADISLTTTTSSGLLTVALGLDWRSGDEVLVPRGEFPSNVWPWKALDRRGVRLREVPLWAGHTAGAEAWRSTPPSGPIAPEERLLDALGPRTRVLAVSWVRFQDGVVLDLEVLGRGCQARGVHLVVDGIQGAGTLQPSLASVSAFCAGGHKGLLSPQGLGMLWTSPQLRQELVPAGSWLSVEDATNFDRPNTDFDRAWRADGIRLEPGSPNLLACAALESGLRLIGDAGVVTIEAHVQRLGAALIDAVAHVPTWRPEAERLAELHARGRLGSIIALHHGDRGPAGLDAILQAGVRQGVHASVREGYLRIALHGWHNDADIERLARWLGAR